MLMSKLTETFHEEAEGESCHLVFSAALASFSRDGDGCHLVVEGYSALLIALVTLHFLLRLFWGQSVSVGLFMAAWGLNGHRFFSRGHGGRTSLSWIKQLTQGEVTG